LAETQKAGFDVFDVIPAFFEREKDTEMCINALFSGLS